MQNKHITTLWTDKDPHTLVNEANGMVKVLSHLVGTQEGPLEMISGEDLYLYLDAVSEKLSAAMGQMEEGK